MTAKLSDAPHLTMFFQRIYTASCFTKESDQSGARPGFIGAATWSAGFSAAAASSAPPPALDCQAADMHLLPSLPRQLPALHAAHSPPQMLRVPEPLLPPFLEVLCVRRLCLLLPLLLPPPLPLHLQPLTMPPQPPPLQPCAGAYPSLVVFPASA